MSSAVVTMLVFSFWFLVLSCKSIIRNYFNTPPTTNQPPVPTLTFTSRIDAPAETLFAWHACPGAFDRLTPPWADVRLERFEGIRDGQKAVIRLGAGPLHRTWVARHHDYIEGQQFCDTQEEGPFRRWTHTHRMNADTSEPGTSVLTDHIEYALPMGSLGQALGGGPIRKQLKRQFAYRHRITKHDLALHRRYNPEGRSLRLAVSGASGLIGSNLIPLLTTGGHTVRRLVRRRPAHDDDIYWNYQTGEIEAEKLEGLDAVIHLAGETVFTPRWTAARQQRILESRSFGTRLISETLARLKHPPRAFLSASGTHYYGIGHSHALTEASPPGETGFLTAVTHAWEAATEPAADAGIRTACLRLGAVLTPRGGALAKMLLPFRLGLGGRVGPKDQQFSWISLDDALGALYHLLMTDTAGGVNLTAPNPVTMDVYTKTLARVLRRPALFAAPTPLATGTVADEVLLASSRVLPERLQQTGYTFRYPALEDALRHQLGRA